MKNKHANKIKKKFIKVKNNEKIICCRGNTALLMLKIYWIRDKYNRFVQGQGCYHLMQNKNYSASFE